MSQHQPQALNKTSHNRGTSVMLAKLKTAASLLPALLFTALAMTANATAPATEGPAIVQMTVHGPVLATAEGRTLYWWIREDASPDESRCDNARQTSYRHVTSHIVYLLQPEQRKTCEQKWPPFGAPDDARPSGKWSVVTRHDGTRQWAFDGHPLHLSVKDDGPGQANGIGVKARNYGGWHVAMAPLAMPPGVGLLPQRQGLVLATDDGRVLYTPEPNQQPCAECNNTPTALVAGAMVNSVGEWTTVSATGGLRQYAFRQQPVFVGHEVANGPWPPVIEGWLPIFFSRNQAPPPAIDIRFSLIGDIYTTTEGMALYVFDCEEGPQRVPCDDPGDAAGHWTIMCGLVEPCAQRWRPYLAAADAEPLGEWSIKTIPHPVFTEPTGNTYAADNNNPTVRVWAYRGRPVYTFADDDEPTQLLGHRIKGLPGSGFYAIQAAGNNDKTMSR